MKDNEDKLHLFLDVREIDRITGDLAERIAIDFKTFHDNGNDLIAIVTLKGALFFAADLIRKIGMPFYIDFVRLSSYGAGDKTSGKVRVLKDIECSVTNRHVLIIDEIVDSGHTIAFLRHHLKDKNPRSIRVATLLSKPSRREVDVEVEYCGKEVEDKFLVGYGLDFNEKYRELKDIYWIDNFC
jgi:hypoxanthine phosphoribosyltransferase